MKYKLKDLIQPISNKFNFAGKSNVIFLNTSDIYDGHISGTKIKPQNLPGQAKKSLKNGDILFSEIRPKNKRFAIVKNIKAEDYVVSTKLMVLRNCNSNILDTRYFYFYLTSPIMIRYLQSEAESRSGTFPQITFKDTMANIEINLPSLFEQKLVVKRIETISSEIYINNQINDNLLELAKAKFAQTYELPTNEFQKIPNGWECSKLDKIITFSNGHNFKSNDMLKVPEPLTYKIFKQGNISIGGGLNDLGTKNWIQKNKVKNLDKYVLKKWDLLMAMTDMKNKVAILGNTALMNRDNQYILNQRVGLIRSNNYNNTSPCYLFLLTNSKPFLHRIRLKAHSGVQVNLSSKDIKNMNILIAPKEVNNNFNIFVKPFFEKIMENQVENLTLREIKQILLNKIF